MNIFVAGASGAIGQPLIAELLRAGHQVTGLTHSAAGAERLLRLGARVAQGERPRCGRGRAGAAASPGRGRDRSVDGIAA